MTISSKVAIAIFVLVAVAGSGALAIIVDTQTQARRMEFRQNVVHKLELLSSALTRPIVNNDHDVVQSTLDNAFFSNITEEIRSLEVIDRQGIVIADLDPRRYNMHTDIKELNDFIFANRLMRDAKKVEEEEREEEREEEERRHEAEDHASAPSEATVQTQAAPQPENPEGPTATTQTGRDKV